MIKGILGRIIAVLITSFITGVGVALTFEIETIATAGLVALFLAIINITIRPIISIITLPLNIVTLGLFSFVVNGLMILLVAQLVPTFMIPSLWAALIFSLVLSFVNGVVHSMEG